jgi:hypothetical protein
MVPITLYSKLLYQTQYNHFVSLEIVVIIWGMHNLHPCIKHNATKMAMRCFVVINARMHLCDSYFNDIEAIICLLLW